MTLNILYMHFILNNVFPQTASNRKVQLVIVIGYEIRDERGNSK